MKTYLKPSVEAVFTETFEMLAESLPIVKGTTVPGSASLAKKNGWDIFGEADEEETD